MADFTLSIADDQVDRVVDALCAFGDYVPGPNDSVKVRRDFAKDIVIRFIRSTVQQVEHNRAVAEAMSSVDVSPVPID